MARHDMAVHQYLDAVSFVGRDYGLQFVIPLHTSGTGAPSLACAFVRLQVVQVVRRPLSTLARFALALRSVELIAAGRGHLSLSRRARPSQRSSPVLPVTPVHPPSSHRYTCSSQLQVARGVQ